MKFPLSFFVCMVWREPKTGDVFGPRKLELSQGQVRVFEYSGNDLKYREPTVFRRHLKRFSTEIFQKPAYLNWNPFFKFSQKFFFFFHVYVPSNHTFPFFLLPRFGNGYNLKQVRTLYLRNIINHGVGFLS